MNGPLPSGLAGKLADYRRRVWIVKLAEGILASIFGLALSYILVLGLDRLIDTPAWLRALLLVAGAAVPGLGLPLKWHRWVWRQRRLEDAARLLRWKFPRLGDQLLGIVELAKEEEGHSGRSERLVQAAMAQADEAVKDQDLSGAVPHAKHRQWAIAATAVLVLSITGFLTINAAARNALERWLMPWKDTERFTFAKVTPLPDPLVVPLAESHELPIALTSDSQWKPDRAKGIIKGQPTIKAQRENDRYQLTLPPQNEDRDLFVKVGDVRETIRVEPRPRPELTELKVRSKLPAYLQYRHDPVSEIRGGSVTLLREAEVQFEATASRELASASVDGNPVKVEGDRLISDTRTVAADPQEAVFIWQDQLGLSARAPLKLAINPTEDEAPKLVARRESMEQVVLDSEVIAFDLTASDDFGIRKVGLQWKGIDTETGQSTTTGEKLTAAGDSEKREIATRATFCAVREGVSPQTLEIRAWAEDYFPDRDRSVSAPFIIHVLDKTDHALWVTQQMGKWLEAAKETYEREQRLHQTNKELRAMSAEDLDRPENRRRIAQQASSEMANAQRLDSLNQSGRQLVEHATKNPEFDAARLESWATMLQSLQDIAANRMPNVSDLLKESANAKADAKPSSQPNNQKPGEGKPGSSKDSKSGPQLNEGESSNAGKPGPPNVSTPDDKPQPEVPSINLTESTMNKPDENENAEQEPQEKPAGKPSFGLPTNSLAAAPGQKPQENQPSSAQQPLNEGVEEQRDLLAEFAKISDQLGEILASLEASTFVKRLKAASREQTSLAGNIREKTLESFGVFRKGEEDAEDGPQFVVAYSAEASKKAQNQSEVVDVIKSDLEAYFQRKPTPHFKKVLKEMRETQIVQALASVGNRAADNLSGNAIHGAEFWADTLDRWAEEMVKAAQCSNCSACSGDSLPPEIVLKVMQALRDEMTLRDETRELENSKSAMEMLNYHRRAGLLAKEQERIGKHTESAIEDILALPNGAQRFGKPLQLLSVVVQVMDEAQDILETPETGAPAIAAETEAIELLLQTKRQNPNGGGGGGSNPGGGGTAASASSAALADLGEGGDANSLVKARRIGQATGTAGRVFPEEFKTGLDAYFSNLEKGS